MSRFLAAHPPFAGLPAGEVERVAAGVRVEFFPAGSEILRQGGTPSDFAYVIRRGEVELVDGDRAVDVLEEGEMFGFPSLLSGKSPPFTVRASEDTLCYLLDRDTTVEVMGSPTAAGFLTASLKRRAVLLRSAAGVRGRAVADIARSPLVTVEPAMPVRQAAGLMTEQGATAVVVAAGSGLGIVTDRDIRARVVAAGLDPGLPVEQVMTAPVQTIRPGAGGEEALARMLELGVHHLPVAEGGRVVGMLTDLDVLRLEQSEAFRLRSDIERSASEEEVVERGRLIPAAAARLLEAGVDGAHAGGAIAALIDAVTARLLDLAFVRLGPAPAPWCWLVLGSVARREPGLAPDQDHALVYADEGEEADAVYAAVAEAVVGGLERVGLGRCPSGVMATDAAWRGTRRWWFGRIEQTTAESSDRDRAFYAMLDLDVRPVAGALPVDDLLTARARAALGHPGFLQRLAGFAAEHPVPIGFLGNLVVAELDRHEGVLDVKRGGLRPVVDIARLAALEAGVLPSDTLERLAAAAAAGTLDPELAEGLAEAFVLFLQVRLRHQVRQWERGEPLDNLIDPGSLGRVERTALKQAFALVREARNLVRERVPRRLLGR